MLEIIGYAFVAIIGIFVLFAIVGKFLSNGSVSYDNLHPKSSRLKPNI